ncbi:hypothetical protein [Winogradskyella jejuensis]|uniref:Uncharacterized protein n=1 Tax=Winogradskyella jejuensis TaxID=1089305 RepID=A0A1M5TNN5_9FLAO|nr:hypothetical protein [Winogradskyella jejuensis]SHH52425.1 hypothetical protein SAMN05444148_2227 [Winogradskyella jejuensis]
MRRRSINIYSLLFITLILLSYTNKLHAQFYITSRSLKKEQPRIAFDSLTYTSVNNETVSGFGFVNPIDAKSIVFVKEKPNESLVKGWKDVKVKSATIYTSKLKDLSFRMLDLDPNLDSIQKKRILTTNYAIDDTIQVFFLRNIKGAIANSLRTLYYENSKARIFKDISSNYYATSQIVYFQKTEKPVYESDTYFLNYNNHKAFKKSVKRFFKTCPKIVENAQNGDYFPRSGKAFRKIADDYERYCEN